jgi:branched-chain amino acid transport system permease protein
LDLKKSYREDLQLFQNKSSLIAFLSLMLGLVVFPIIALRVAGGAYYINVVNLIAINVIVAIGLNILVGYTGQVSLGHAGFYAIGAYAQAMLVTKAGVPFPVALLIAGLLAGAFGLLLGLPSLRLEGPYLAIATLGFGMAVTQIIGRLDFLGGRMGLTVPGPGFVDWLKGVIGSRVSAERAVDAPLYAIYMIAIPLTVLLAIAAVNLMKSKIGRAFVAIRDSDISAEAIGVNLTRYKTLAFAVSAFFTGVAGGLYSHAMGFINPESFDLRLSITFLAMVVVGGLGSILGSILGAILMTILPLSLTAVRDVPEIIYGAIMILIILFEPLGLRGRWLKLKSYWKTWPF